MHPAFTHSSARLKVPKQAPKVSVIVTTFQRPNSLNKVLTSLRCQDFSGSYEVIVADDGSTDTTQKVVNRHSAAADFHIGFVTHPHRAFELARCRNEGMQVAHGRYLIFLDGDCVAPPNFLTQHMKLRQVGKAVAGFTCHLDQRTSNVLNENVISKGDYVSWADRSCYRQLEKMDRKANFYRMMHHPSKPRLRGGNFGVWRSDYERINGFDESFVGWGCEDDDFGMRLRRIGIEIRNAFRATPTYHLWHPVDKTAPTKWRDGANAKYLHRKVRWTRCLNGLEKRSLSDLSVYVSDNERYRQWLENILTPTRLLPPDSNGKPKPEIEVVVGTHARFQRNTDCRVLVLPESTKRLPPTAKKADLILSDLNIKALKNKSQVTLSGFHEFLQTETMRTSANEKAAIAA